MLFSRWSGYVSVGFIIAFLKFVVSFFITGRNEVLAKVIFLHLSHSVHGGGGSPSPEGFSLPDPPGRPDTPRGADPPEQTPPAWRNPLVPDPPGSRPPPGSRLRHTVYDRPVRILLECILVNNVRSIVTPKERTSIPSRLLSVVLHDPLLKIKICATLHGHDLY